MNNRMKRKLSKRTAIPLIQKGLACLLLLALTPVALSENTDEDKSIETEKDVAAKKEDLIRLESTFIGDKEQPAVSYFIPWKGTGSPDKLQWKIERKIDDTLSLVDRDIMLRSMTIYNQMRLEP
jgi:hypothetical protein